MRSLFCTVLVVLLAGCATPVSPEQAHRDAMDWRNRLEPLNQAEREEVTVDGRRVVIVRQRIVRTPPPTAPDQDKYAGVAKYNRFYVNGTFDRLVDAETNEELLPVDYQSIIHVPGYGLLMRPTDAMPYFRSPLTLHPIKQPGEYWAINLRTLTWVPFGVMRVGYRPPLDVRDDQRNQAPREQWTIVVQQKTPDGSMHVTILEPRDDGYVEHEHPRLIGDPSDWDNGLWAGEHWIIAARDEAGNEITKVIHRDGELRMTTDEPVETFQLRRMVTPDVRSSHRIAMMRAPGTVEEEDLWVPMTRSGYFAPPAGIIGYRPINLRENPQLGPGAGHRREPDGTRVVHRWLASRNEYAAFERGYDGLATEFNGFWALHNVRFEPEVQDTGLFKAELVRFPKVRQGNPARPEFETLLCVNVGWQWEVFDLDVTIGHDGQRPRPKMTGKSLEEIVTRRTRSVEAVVSAWKAIEAEKARKAALRAAQIRQSDLATYSFASGSGDWNRAGQIALRLGGPTLVDYALRSPRPTLRVMDFAINSTGNADSLRRLRSRRASLDRQYRQEDALAAAPAPAPRATSYSGWQYRSPSSTSSSSYKPFVWQASDANKRAYEKAAVYSPHARSMGWQR
ncbi:MAG: hypothetical protein AAGI46_00960 [Planctomycetota bacterium]